MDRRNSPDPAKFGDAVDASMPLAERLFAELEEKTADGDGVTRGSYGEGEQIAHDLLEDAARSLDLEIDKDPAGNLYNTQREIKEIADFSGLKFRSTTYVVSEALRIFGAVPVAGPVTALRDGLAKGVYDGTSFTDEAVYNFKISKFIKYVTHFPGGLYNTSFLIVMNKNSWSKIAKADQEIVMKYSGETYSKRIGKRWDEYEAAAPAKLKADGVTYVTLGGKTLEEVKAKIGHFEKEWIDKVGKLGVDGVATLKMFRDEVAAYGS